MNINRAKEILNSTDKIDVYYKGRSVWINSVSPNNGTAFVKTLDGSNEQYQVSVNELNEK